jgi:hypothetical protein
VKLRWLPDETTGETTSHPTKQPEDGCQVVGYSHSTSLSKDDSQVAGYRELLMKQLAIRLDCQNTPAKPLVIAVPLALSASFARRRLV